MLTFFNKRLHNKKGFTLIELIVVIAIIGILASIVLVSLGAARSKANDVAIKADFSSLRAAAELYAMDNGSSYASFCAEDPGDYDKANTAATTEHGSAETACNDVAGAWAACAELVETNTEAFCVDSTGNAKVLAATDCGVFAATVCP
jgi:prepilin-type N-terminal cleavage/methylation domain-containing protein